VSINPFSCPAMAVGFYIVYAGVGIGIKFCFNIHIFVGRYTNVMQTAIHQIRCGTKATFLPL